MNLASLQKEAHAIAKDHGWWDEERSFGDLIALVHSELSEALEEYRGKHIWADWRQLHTYPNGRPRGVASELADVVIRVVDMVEGCDIGMHACVAEARTKGADDIRALELDSFGSWIAELHGTVTFMYIAYMRGLYGPSVTEEAWDKLERMTAMFIGQVEVMAAHYGIDLDAAIAAKMEYNQSRPYRHGGKAL